MSNQWQDELRSRMEHYEEPAPEGLWERVEQMMNAGSGTIARPVGKGVGMWYRRAGAVAAVGIVLFFTGLYLFRENQKNVQSVALQDSNERHAPATLSIRKPQLAQQLGPVAPVAPVRPVAVVRPLPVIDEVSAEQPETSAEQPETSVEQPEAVDESPLPAPKIERSNTPASSGKEEFRLPARRRNSQPARWQTDLYANNIPSGSVAHYDGYRTFTPSGLVSDEKEELLAGRAEVPGTFLVGDEYRHVYTDISHSQPVTLGFSLKYGLGDRWSITGGVNYTMLTSRLSTGSYSQYYRSRQTLHYLGLPVSLNYTFWRGDKLSAYVSGGGAVEKSVSGSLTTDYIVDNVEEERIEERMRVKPLQWSATAGAGVEYRFWKRIGLYAEPGMSYHFSNGSRVETIYREKPLNFNIRLGLRFTLTD